MSVRVGPAPPFDGADHVPAELGKAWNEALRVPGAMDAIKAVVDAAWEAGFSHATGSIAAVQGAMDAVANNPAGMKIHLVKTGGDT